MKPRKPIGLARARDFSPRRDYAAIQSVLEEQTRCCETSWTATRSTEVLTSHVAPALPHGKRPTLIPQMRPRR
jgi:hypothetical protein